MSSSGWAWVMVVSAGGLAACSSSVDIGGSGANGGGAATGSTGIGGAGASGGSATTVTASSTSSQATSSGSSTGSSTSSSSVGGGGPCNHAPNEDGDGDGWTGLEGDCNDCNPNVNPGALEVLVTPDDFDGGIPEPADEDCDGAIDNIAPTCDVGLVYDDTDAMHAAKAIDLCETTSVAAKTWGVIKAKYVRANGAFYAPPGLQSGIQAGFGPNVHVQGGERMLALSSGHGRLPGQLGSCQDMQTISCSSNVGGAPPPGFPQDVPGCFDAVSISDDVALDLEIRAPSNAKGYSFDFDFYTYDYPEWVCTSYGDQFVALVNPPPMGSINGNISFDGMNNPVSANIAFMSVCAGCPQGLSQMLGTGFNNLDDAGATGWLRSQAPINGGEVFSIRFAIWDTGDTSYDSTVLIDNFRWITSGGAVLVTTAPVAMPK